MFTYKREGLMRENIARRRAEMEEGHWVEGRDEVIYSEGDLV